MKDEGVRTSRAGERRESLTFSKEVPSFEDVIWNEDCRSRRQRLPLNAS
jgi:hypothetical protein